MGRLNMSGFELGSADEFGESSDASVQLSWSTSIKRSGNYALRVNKTTNTAAYVGMIIPGATTNRVYRGRAYIYIASAPTGADIEIMRFNQSTTALDGAAIRLTSSSTLKLVTSSGDQIGSSSGALSLNTWYRVELRGNFSGNAGEALLDGSSFATGDLSTGASAGFDADSFRVGNCNSVNSSNCDLYFDDIAVNDEQGTSENSWPGAGQIVTFRPTAAGDNPLPAGTFADIDDVPANDATRVEIQANGDIGDYNVSATTDLGIGSSDTVKVIQVGVRVRTSSTTSSANFRERLKSASGGTTSTTANITVQSLTTAAYDDTLLSRFPSLTSYTDPTTTVAWTPTGTNSLENMQIGVLGGTDSDPDIYISELWANVELASLNPGGGGGTVVKDIIGLGIIPPAR